MSEKNKQQKNSTNPAQKADKNTETINTSPAKTSETEPTKTNADKQDSKPQANTAATKKPEAAAPVIVKKQRSTLGFIALIIAGGTLASGYQLWQQNLQAQTALLERVYVAEQNTEAAQMAAQAAQDSINSKQSSTDTLQSSITALQAQYDELASNLTKLSGDIKRSTENIDQIWPLKEGQQVLKAKVSTLKDEVNALKIAPDISRTDWLLAETKHLMNIANHQSQLGNNKDAAIAALETANQRLGQIANPTIGAVRQVVSDTIIALRNTDQPDIAAIAQSLSSLEMSVSKLQEIAPGTRTANTSSEATADIEVTSIGSFFDKLWSDTQALVTIRRASSEDAPILLPPGQRFFLQQNLRLKLEAARIALLNGDTATFHGSLKTTRDWLNTYFDTSNTAAANMLTTLSPWENIELNPTLPSSDNALRALEQWQQRNSTYIAPATSAAEVNP